MSYIVQKKLPHPDEIKGKLPRTMELSENVHRDRHEIVEIITGKNPRKLLIIGPCSAWPDEAIQEYANKLAPVMKKTEKTLKIVLRVYTQKPRTTIGWTGPLTQPDPYKEADIEKGILYCRKMCLELIKKGFALADEALFTHNDGYFVDLLSWIAVGARSAEDQEHRVFASMISHPVGLKNPTSGNLSVGINSVIAAQASHVFALHGRQVLTSGNPLAHLILRGGNKKSNYHLEKLEKATKLLTEKTKNPSIIIDASHENCIDENGKKDAFRQEQVIFDSLKSMQKSREIFTSVKGWMVESFLKDGNQNLNDFTDINELEFGKSVTDPCIGIEKTIQLIENLDRKLQQK